MRVSESCARQFAAANRDSRGCLLAVAVDGARLSQERDIELVGRALETIVVDYSGKSVPDLRADMAQTMPTVSEPPPVALMSGVTMFAAEQIAAAPAACLGFVRVELLRIKPADGGRRFDERVRISYVVVDDNDPMFDLLVRAQALRNGLHPGSAESKQATRRDAERQLSLAQQYGELTPLALVAAQVASVPLDEAAANALRSRWLTAMDTSASDVLDVLKDPERLPSIASETRIQGVRWRATQDGLLVTLTHPGVDAFTPGQGGAFMIVANLLPTLIRIWQAGELK
ncbi:MAG: hypothetical protein KDE27_16700 [Planctomycetes bacterium]|nr:hypothetical protein [Planctomycetota bacterium]